jgi:hypothetical protein
VYNSLVIGHILAAHNSLMGKSVYLSGAALDYLFNEILDTIENAAMACIVEEYDEVLSKIDIFVQVSLFLHEFYRLCSREYI